MHKEAWRLSDDPSAGPSAPQLAPQPKLSRNPVYDMFHQAGNQAKGKPGVKRTVRSADAPKAKHGMDFGTKKYKRVFQGTPWAHGSKSRKELEEEDEEEEDA